jgi:hypothetical protein
MRSGGRVLTLREPFSDGLYADAGAARIPDNHDITLHYVRHSSSLFTRTNWPEFMCSRESESPFRR